MSIGPNITISSAELTATIAPSGAELTSLRRRDGLELLWQGDPASWPEQAPILFPLLGPLTNQTLRHRGHTYHMPPHGFAKSRTFELIEQSDSRCLLRISDDEQIRSMYPFSFQFDVEYEIRANALLSTIHVTNTGNETMPCDVGFHPGFQWPLKPDVDKDAHWIVFEDPEPAPIRRGIDDPIFLYGDPHPTPVSGDVLQLTESLFEDQAIVFDRIRSRSIIYKADSGPSLQIDFPDCPYLALWMRPGANYICIEPWQGLPVEHGWDGEYLDKPGAAHIEPGAARSWRLGVTVTGQART